MSYCEDLKTRSIAAYKQQQIDQEKQRVELRRKESQVAFVQLSATFPALERTDDGRYQLCGHVFSTTCIGTRFNGQPWYCLRPDKGWYGDMIYDEASLGRYLLSLEATVSSPSKRGFFARLFN